MAHTTPQLRADAARLALEAITSAQAAGRVAPTLRAIVAALAADADFASACPYPYKTESRYRWLNTLAYWQLRRLLRQGLIVTVKGVGVRGRSVTAYQLATINRGDN